MLFDHCTWDDDYKQITQEIRKSLLELAHVPEEEYTAVLMQGSGSFGVESVLTSVVGSGDELLICANGAYGERMADIAQHAGLKYQIYNEHYNKVPNAQKIAEMLDADPAITHVAMVHSETTSGILNDIEAVGRVVKERGRVFIVDAMSSFGGVDIRLRTGGSILLSAAPTNASRACRASLSSSRAGTFWRRVRVKPEAFLLTFMTSGRPWKWTASGALRRRPMWSLPLRRR